MHHRRLGRDVAEAECVPEFVQRGRVQRRRGGAVLRPRAVRVEVHIRRSADWPRVRDGAACAKRFARAVASATPCERDVRRGFVVRPRHPHGARRVPLRDRALHRGGEVRMGDRALRLFDAIAQRARIVPAPADCERRPVQGLGRCGGLLLARRIGAWRRRLAATGCCCAAEHCEQHAGRKLHHRSRKKSSSDCLSCVDSAT